MGRIEKTVFISYRRANFPWALAIYQDLTHHGYDAFFDYQSIDSGSFEKVILENIKSRAHFILIFTPSALERCKNPGDWLRREIETAIDENRNIVPLMMEGFDFGSPFVKEALNGKLAVLSGINALQVPEAYAVEAMNRLRERFLNISLSDVVLPTLPEEVQARTAAEKTAANEAPAVKEEQLTAQTWFERGYVFQENNNLEETIRCYSEAIRLDQNLIEAYGNLGNAYADKGDFEKAFANYNKVLEIDPNDAGAYCNLGLLLQNLKRYDEAEAAYRKSIRLDSSDATAYYNLGNLLRHLKRYDEAGVNYRKAIELNPHNTDTYYELIILLRTVDKIEETMPLLEKMIEIEPQEFELYLTFASIDKQIGRNIPNEYLAKARQFIPEDDWYNRACLESMCDNFDSALEYLEKATKTDGFDPAWGWEDPDLQWIRADPRFTEIVGPKPT